jgi:hypothetical protein
VYFIPDVRALQVGDLERALTVCAHLLELERLAVVSVGPRLVHEREVNDAAQVLGLALACTYASTPEPAVDLDLLADRGDREASSGASTGRMGALSASLSSPSS